MMATTERSDATQPPGDGSGPKIVSSVEQQEAMPRDAFERFVSKPWIAVLSWLSPRGEVRSTPVWYEHKGGGRFWLHTNIESVKLKALRKSPGVTLCIQDPAPPYRYITVRAKARIIDDAKAGFELDSRLSRRYLGRQGGKYYMENVYPTLESDSCIVELEPTKVSSFDGTAGINPALIMAMRAARKVGL
jgi:PPOX class probable F420-dependent enzyme